MPRGLTREDAASAIKSHVERRIEVLGKVLKQVLDKIGYGIELFEADLAFRVFVFVHRLFISTSTIRTKLPYETSFRVLFGDDRLSKYAST